MTYTIKYITNTSRYKRHSTQTLTNLSKQDAKDWLAWLTTVKQTTYKITTSTCKQKNKRSLHQF